LGVAVVPRLALPPPPSTVVGVKLDKPAISRTIGIIRRAGRSLSPAGEALAKLLTQASRATAKTMRR